MLSILIPIYNRFVVSLVDQLHTQAGRLDVPCEIVLVDDASTDAVRKVNRQFCVDQFQCRLFELRENHGPAFVRNCLVKLAHYPYLLFLDADTRPIADDFLSQYLRLAQQGRVVCGGFRYVPMTKEYRERHHTALRYKYGVKVESEPASVRKRRPYQHFISMNFFVPREVMLRIPFDETFHLGYEDTAFGKQLADAGISILHIDNDVWHLIIEDTTQFLAKTARAVRNLIGHETELQSYVRLLAAYRFLKRCGAVRATAWLYRQLETRIIRHLLGTNPRLIVFAFYKLGVFCCLIKEESLPLRAPAKQETL
ncbi:MAG: glycosyltransferase [Prevotellaceae bacterium]|jgi:GT2 family glycosyltransferase|nr:glycosyltransferase [Prevotellaceae bacterium]